MRRARSRDGLTALEAGAALRQVRRRRRPDDSPPGGWPSWASGIFGEVAAIAKQVCAQRRWELAQVRFYTGVSDVGGNPKWDSFWTHKLAAMAMGRRGVVVYTRPLRFRNRRVDQPDGTQHSSWPSSAGRTKTSLRSPMRFAYSCGDSSGGPRSPLPSRTAPLPATGGGSDVRVPVDEPLGHRSLRSGPPDDASSSAPIRRAVSVKC